MSKDFHTDWPSIDSMTKTLKEKIDNATTIACIAHKDADADSLGSALGFALALKSAGKEVYPLVPTPLPKTLDYLPGYQLIATTNVPESFDLVLTFDCPTLARFGDMREVVENASFVIVVDHHISNDKFGDLHVVDPSASATGQIVYALLNNLHYPVTADTATNLYAALFTDTGGFRHENTTEEALRLGADLVAHGADPGWVALKSYKSRSLAQVRLSAAVLATIQTDHNNDLIWSYVTQKMLTDANASLQEAEGLVDELQSIATMQICILFKEFTKDVTKVSVRTRPPYDATAVCSPFGGGGHVRASGAEFMLPLAKAMPEMLEVARNLLK